MNHVYVLMAQHRAKDRAAFPHTVFKARSEAEAHCEAEIKIGGGEWHFWVIDVEFYDGGTIPS